ncbi:MAG: aromatic ring-hydroxylating dioxygenase subunit alpha [Ktedonobacteraceae bacterium]
MLSKEQNERLTQVGPGTPAGTFLRNYWFPVAGVSEFEKKPTKRVRLLGEDLVLYRDRRGQYGLLAERCPHRSASLGYGIAENEGLRCMYHGWLFDSAGRCQEQPNEPGESTFKNRIKTTAYAVQELGGLLFAYLGPEPAPLLPRFDLFVRNDAIRTIGYAVIPANWLQIMENSLDPTHLEWLHGKYFEQLWRLQGRDVTNWTFSKHHLKIGFDQFEYGIIKRRVLEGQTEESEDWAVGHPVIFPNMLRVGDGSLHTFQIRVPMDDTHTYHIWYSCFIKPELAHVPEDYPTSFFEIPIKDESGDFITDYIDGQDIMAWASQGEITNRLIEHLGTSDKGIILYRKMLQQEIAKAEQGEDTLCVLRDPIRNECIELPQEKNKYNEQAAMFKAARNWNTRYAPNLEEILALLEPKRASVVAE